MLTPGHKTRHGSRKVNTIAEITGTCAGALRQAAEEAKEARQAGDESQPTRCQKASIQLVLPLIRVSQSESETAPAPGLIDEPSRPGQASNHQGLKRTNTTSAAAKAGKGEL